MDWQKNRLAVGLVALLVLGGAAIWAVRTRTGDSPPESNDTNIPGFPSEIDRDDVTSLEITRPNETAVRLERRDGGWRVVSPVEARADQTSIDSALDKLAELEVESVAARSATYHERLEVDAAHGIRVVARNGEQVLADLWIGASRSGNTAVRVEGQDAVAMVDGSIRFAFNRDLKDWRDRTILDLEADEVREVEWVGDNGRFRFRRPLERPTLPADVDAGAEAAGPEPVPGDWTVVEVSYLPSLPADVDAGPPRPRTPVTTIENFQPTKVRTVVSGLARLRASDFAAADVTRESAGIGESSPRVTLTMADGQVHVLRLGRSPEGSSDQFYVVHEGDDTIFVVSRYHSTRIHPTVSEFQASGSSPPSPSPSSSSGSESGSEGNQIPPEILRQLQQQLQHP